MEFKFKIKGSASKVDGSVDYYKVQCEAIGNLKYKDLKEANDDISIEITTGSYLENPVEHFWLMASEAYINTLKDVVVISPMSIDVISSKLGTGIVIRLII